MNIVSDFVRQVLSRVGSIQVFRWSTVARRSLIPIFLLLSGHLTSAGEETFGDFNYTFVDGAVAITKYNGVGGDVTIPDTILDTPVVKISSFTFNNCTGLKSVTIPSSVTWIDYCAFSYCANLSSVTLPSGVTNIGVQAFSGCKSLPSIIIPDSVANIGDQVFYDCSSLTNVTLPTTITNFGYAAFSACTSLKHFTVPDGVISIGDNAFSYCTGLTNITIPNSVISIGKLAFSSCSLPNITIPDSVTSMGASALSGCRGLTNVVIPNSVTSIGEYTFNGCINLTNVTIGSGVTNIGHAAFQGCSSLVAIVVEPLNMVYGSVDGVMFDKNLTTLVQCPEAVIGDFVVPNSVTNIENSAFYQCSKLTSVIISDNITSIGDYVFYYCRSLTNVTMPNGLTTLGNHAFEDCGGLKNLNVPNSVTNIGIKAFYNCWSLTNIALPANATYIGDQAFSYCGGLTMVTIPAGVTYIGDQAFFGCEGLKTITVDPLNSSFSSMDGVLFNKGQTKLIQYPGGGIGTYMVPQKVTSIQEVAFSGCSSLTAITVDPLNSSFSSVAGVLFDKNQTMLLACPGGREGAYSIVNSAASIGNYAFYDCSRLTGIGIPNSVTNIGTRAFQGCTNLTSMAIPNNINKISDYVFFECSGLTNIAFPRSVNLIGESVFIGCDNLTGLYFEGNAPRTGWLFLNSTTVTVYYRKGTTGWSFSFSGLETAVWLDPEVQDFEYQQNGSTITITGFTGISGAVIIPDTIFGENVATIGASAFAGQTSLTSISIPGSVTNIGASAFADCTNLTSVLFKGNAPTVSATGDQFKNSPNVTVYYRAGTTGWESTFAGRPTALWIEQPSYLDWAATTGLAAKFPDASAETDDADHDGMANLAEMQAGTDPIDPNSKLAFESVLRPNDLEEADKTPAGSDQLALYFQTVPGKEYAIQSVSAVGGAWQTETNVTATTSQKRVLVNKPIGQGFYRIVLAP